MNCKKIKDLLLSDYIDNENDQSLRKQIQEHLEHCASCSRLEQEAQQVRIPFKKAQRIQPPFEVWENIRERITQERQQEYQWGWIGFRSWLDRLLARREPVFVAATALALIIAVFVWSRMAFHPYYVQRKGNNHEVAFMLSLNGQDDDMTNDLGTSIEEYFL